MAEKRRCQQQSQQRSNSNSNFDQGINSWCSKISFGSEENIKENN